MFLFERILERLTASKYHNNFILKGGLLISSMIGISERTTMIDVTTGDVITSAAIRYDFFMLFDEKTVPVMAYTLETVLAEKYETIVRRNIGTTRARDFYDLHTLYRSYKNEIRPDVSKAAVLHTVKKRDPVDDIHD